MPPLGLPHAAHHFPRARFTPTGEARFQSAHPRPMDHAVINLVDDSTLHRMQSVLHSVTRFTSRHTLTSIPPLSSNYFAPTMVSLTPLSTGPALSAPDLLQLPRPGTASPNPSGTRALWPASAFSFDAAGGAGRTAKSVYLVDLPKVADAAADGTAGKASGGIKEVLSNLVYSEAVWLDDNNFLFLRPPYVKGGEEGVSEGDRVDHPVEVSDKDNKARVAKAAGEEGGEGVELWAHDLADGEDYLITKLPVV